MKHVVDNQFVLSRAPEGLLAPWLDGFARYLSVKGYAVATNYRRVQRAASFSRWLQQKRIELSDLTFDHPALYVRYRARSRTTLPGQATDEPVVQFYAAAPVHFLSAVNSTYFKIKPIIHCNRTRKNVSDIQIRISVIKPNAAFFKVWTVPDFLRRRLAISA